MPEANALYTVTAVVVAALVVWVLAVLKTAKEPWARPAAEAAVAAAAARDTERAPDVPVEKTTEDVAEKADEPAPPEEQGAETEEEDKAAEEEEKKA